jgi:Tripartite tricarboxylate transporter TctB family
MSESGAHADRANPGPTGRKISADRVGGFVWILFGAIVFYGSWTMDRLESQGVEPITAPGLLPGLLGLGMIGFGLVLVLRRGAALHSGFEPAGHLGIAAESNAGAPDTLIDWRRLGLSWLLSIAFAGVLLGRGLPFWLLAAAFMFLHLVLLEDDDRIAARPLGRRLIVAALIAGGVAAAVTLIFQDLFLIRLP